MAIEAPEEAAGSAAPSPLSRTHDRLLIGTAILAIAFLCSQILMFGYGRDQGIYAMVADSILRGGMPYRDAWDFKTPGIFLVYGLSRLLFGPSQVGIRVLEVVGLVGMCFGLVRLGERFFRSRTAGFLAAGLAALAHAQLDFWHTAQPESFGGMLTVFALLLAAQPFDRTPPGRRAVFLAGVLFGLTGLLKPPLAGGGAILGLYMGYREWSFAAPASTLRNRLFSAAKPSLWIALGGVAPMVLVALWFAARGAMGDLRQVLFVFTPYYTKLGWEGATLGGMFYWGFIEWLTSYCSALSVGVLLALGFGATAKEKPFLALLAGIIAMHLAGVTMQAKFFPYHYGATWPLTALVAGFGFEKLYRRLERRGALGAGAFAVLFALSCYGRSGTKDTLDSFMTRCRKRVVVALGGLRDQATLDYLATVADVNAGDNRGAAEHLRAKVPVGRTVFVWGFEPVIYDLADRRPASRFLYNVPQRVPWAKAGMREILLRDLAAHPPAAVVVEHRDVIPMVTGDGIDSADTLYDFWDFYVFLQRYRLDKTIGQLDVYLEKEPVTAASP